MGIFSWFFGPDEKVSMEPAKPAPEQIYQNMDNEPAARKKNLNLDGFCFHGCLGKGGMGEVLKVSALVSSRSFFALKRAHIGDPKLKSILFAELCAWSSLPQHPNLVPFCFFKL